MGKGILFMLQRSNNRRYKETTRFSFCPCIKKTFEIRLMKLRKFPLQ